MSKVIIQGYIIIPKIDIDAVKNELPTHKSLTLKETGCITFIVTEDEHNPNKVSFYEEFVNKAAFESHQKRSNSSNWAEVTKNVEKKFKISTED